jgi:DNA replication protein DnaC
MLDNLTKDHLLSLRLKGMLHALELQRFQPEMLHLSFEDRFGLLIDAEINLRDQNRIQRYLKAAHLRYPKATLEGIDYQRERRIERSVISSLASCDWVKARQNIIITGSTGTGKSWLGCAFGSQTCRLGISTYYTSSHQLFEDLSRTIADGTLPKFRRKLVHTELLIIDDFGLGGVDPSLGPSILEIIDLQSAHGALLLTSQFPTVQWHSLFNDPTIADAILDRIVHGAHLIELFGESMRKRQGKNM